MRGGLRFLSSMPHDVQRDEFTHVAFAGDNISQCSVRGYIGPRPAWKFWAFCSKFMTPSLRDFFFVCISECIFFSLGSKCEHCFKERTVNTKSIFFYCFTLKTDTALVQKFCNYSPLLVDTAQRLRQACMIKAIYLCSVFLSVVHWNIGKM